VIEQAFAPLPGKDGDARTVALVTESPQSTSPDASLPSCRTQTVWLVRLNGAGAVVDRQLVGEGCAIDTPPGGACDGAGPISVHAPTIEKPNSVVVSWDSAGPGCGGWTRATVEIEVSLESLSLLHRSEWQGRVMDPDDSRSKSWDLEKLHFVSEWNLEQGGSCARRKRGPFLGIPRMALPESFVERDWRAMGFDSCATVIDEAHGLPIHGAGKARATLRVLMSDTNSLFVDIAEDSKVGAGASLQICFAEWNAQSYDYCQVSGQPECTRVTMAGRVLSGNVPVERAADSSRFRFQLPSEAEAVSVHYIEPGGRSIGSSRFHPRDLTSLGNVFPIRSSVATCKLVDEELVFSPAMREPDRPLLDPEGLE
jgi:hypothetical protein